VNNIDKQHVAGVEKLEQLGYTFAGEWHPANDASVADLEGSAMRCPLSPGGRAIATWAPPRAGRGALSLLNSVGGALTLSARTRVEKVFRSWERRWLFDAGAVTSAEVAEIKTVGAN